MPQVVVDFVANTKGLQKGIADTKSSTGGLTSKLGGLAKVGALAGGAAGVGALVATLKIGWDDMQAGQKLAAQTNAVLKSTGEVAGVTADHVGDLAGSLMRKSGVDDDAITSGENLLLTFTNIRNEAGKGNDIFDQTTKTMTDMSVALGQDMKTSSIQLGKALNDPIKGVGALSKVGVSFTEGQKKQIKAMVEAGNTMGAQKVILGELNKEFGGSAEAAGKTLPGQINILKTTFGNFAGDLVAKLVPALESSIGWLQEHWPEISAVITKTWNEDIKPALDAFIELGKALVGVFVDNWGTIEPIIVKLATVVQDAFKVITDAIKIVTAVIRGDWGEAWQQLKDLVVDALKLVVDILKLDSAYVGAIVKAALTMGKAILGGVVSGLAGIGDAAWNVIREVGSTITGLVDTIKGWGSDAGGWIKGAVVSALGGIGSAAWGVINNIGSFLLTVVDTVKGWGSDVASWITGAIVGGFKTIGSDVWEAIKGIGAYLANAANGVRTKVIGWGSDIGGWLRDGITAALSTIKAGLTGVIGGAINAAIDLVNRGLHAIRDHWPDVPGAPGPPGFLDGIPPVQLARGGLISQPTLALIGEGPGREIVSPERLLRSIVAEARGDVHVRVFIGDQELRGMVRAEVSSSNTGIARALIAGAA